MSTAILFRTTITRTIILHLLSLERLSCPDEFQPFLTCKIKPDDLRRSPKITMLLVIVVSISRCDFSERPAAVKSAALSPLLLLRTCLHESTQIFERTNLHGSAFRVNETRGTVQFSSEQQTVLQSATQNLHGSVLTGCTGENSSVKNFFRAHVNNV